MKKSQLRKIIRESIKGLLTEQICDNTPSGACAQQWFGSRAIKMTNFMGNKQCTGHYNFDGAYNHYYGKTQNIISAWYSASYNLLGYFPENELNNILNATTYQQINNSVNIMAGLANIHGGQRDKLKRVMAKHKWANCMINECSC